MSTRTLATAIDDAAEQQQHATETAAAEKRTDTDGAITIKVRRYKGGRTSRLAMKYDNRCACCGRPKPHYTGSYVRVLRVTRHAATVAPIAMGEVTEDNFYEFETIGSGCVRKLPKTHHLPVNKAY